MTEIYSVIRNEVCEHNVRGKKNDGKVIQQIKDTDDGSSYDRYYF